MAECSSWAYLSGVDDQRGAKTAALDKVNRHILNVASEVVPEDQQWAFFCECGRAECHEYVTLTLAAYGSIRDARGAVLAPGHRLSQLERARRLQDDAEALRRQAEQQVKRAKRNRFDRWADPTR